MQPCRPWQSFPTGAAWSARPVSQVRYADAILDKSEKSFADMPDLPWFGFPLTEDRLTSVSACLFGQARAPHEVFNTRFQQACSFQGIIDLFERH